VQYVIDFIFTVHERIGDTGFLAISAVVSLLLCFIAIPLTTDLMVNHAAGISGRIFGASSRTLVINASTNNPELFSMAVSLWTRRMGGWANPLGSLLANCYLMYLVGIFWVAFVFLVKGDLRSLRRFISLLWSERLLIFWHLAIALSMFVCGFLALRIMQAGLTKTALLPTLPAADPPVGDLDIAAQASGEFITTYPVTGTAPYVALVLLVIGAISFWFFETRLKRKRPNLFLDIDDTEHGHSVIMFLIGTAGLIAACWFMNVLFLAWSSIYHDTLSRVFGTAIFAGLHYVLGALITSLPELRVATSNYRRLNAADMNTALASASYSNFTNIVICAGGLILFIVLTWNGYVMPWE